MRAQTRAREDRPGFGAQPPQGSPALPRPAPSRGTLDVLRAIWLRILLAFEAWFERWLSSEARERVFLSALEELISFSERLTAILLMIPSAGAAVLTYYGVAGPLTETGSTAIQKGQAVGFALAIGVFIWLAWFYLFGLIHRLEGRELRNALIAGGLMVGSIALIDAPFNMLALAGGPAAQMSLVSMAHSYEQRRDALIAGATAMRKMLPALRVQGQRFAKLKAQEEKSGTYSGKGKPGKVSATFGQAADLLGGLATELDGGLGRIDALQAEMTASFGKLKGFAYQQGPIRERMEGASSAADRIDVLLAQAGQYDFGASIESTLASLDASLLRPQATGDSFAQTQAAEVGAVAAMAKPVADSLRASLAELRAQPHPVVEAQRPESPLTAVRTYWRELLPHWCAALFIDFAPAALLFLLIAARRQSDKDAG